MSCPICGSKDYIEKRGSNKAWDYSWVEHYVCSGCSVMFLDAEKFMKEHRTISKDRYAPEHKIG